MLDAGGMIPSTMIVWYYLVKLNMYMGNNTGIPTSGVFLKDILSRNKADKHRNVYSCFLLTTTEELI